MPDCPTSSGYAPLAFTTATSIDPVLTTGDPVVTDNALTAVSTCPIGFYGYAAIHHGGCCRTGRNCDTTDCPAIEDTTLISAGATIVVPVGPAGSFAFPTATSGDGYCAQGWYNCGYVLGGGCCPTGFDCGLASCSLFSGTRTLDVGPKESTSGGMRSRRIAMKGWLGGVVWGCDPHFDDVVLTENWASDAGYSGYEWGKILE